MPQWLATVVWGLRLQRSERCFYRICIGGCHTPLAFVASRHAPQGRTRYSCLVACGNWYLHSPFFHALQKERIGATTDSAVQILSVVFDNRAISALSECVGAAGHVAKKPSQVRRFARLSLRTCSRSFQGRTSTLPGWDARRGAQWIARLSTSAATPQTARQGTCPKGWSEIGRLDAPAACMGMSPCCASEASTHPDCTPMRSPKRF
jgi:hypothetical protein